jgi:hypothetical protein
MTSEAPYPSEQPRDDDWTSQFPPPPGAGGQPRFSASVPLPPRPDPAASYPSTPSFSSAPHDPYAQNQPGQGQPGQHPVGGHPRAAASASVPVPPAGNQYPTTPTTYGQPTQYGPGLYGQGGQGGQGGMGQPPMGQGMPPMGQAPMGQPPMGGYAPPGYASDPRAGGRDKQAPTGGWPYVEQPQLAPRKSRRWLVISLIAVGALILIAGAGAIGYTIFAGRGNAYHVGACVKQHGDGAAVVDCGTAGAFTIVSLVDGEDQCPDPTQPSIELTGGGKARQIACLRPARG